MYRSPNSASFWFAQTLRNRWLVAATICIEKTHPLRNSTSIDSVGCSPRRGCPAWAAVNPASRTPRTPGSCATVLRNRRGAFCKWKQEAMGTRVINNLRGLFFFFFLLVVLWIFRLVVKIQGLLIHVKFCNLYLGDACISWDYKNLVLFSCWEHEYFSTSLPEFSWSQKTKKPLDTIDLLVPCPDWAIVDLIMRGGLESARNRTCTRRLHVRKYGTT